MKYDYLLFVAWGGTGSVVISTGKPPLDAERIENTIYETLVYETIV